MVRGFTPEHAALVASDRPDARFDALVIDEAQDILTTPNLDALNEILHGGLEQGRWCVFLDGREQAKVYGKLDPEALGRLTALGVRERLTLNCRNTRPIAQQTALVSDSQWRVKARIDGRPVDFPPVRPRSGGRHERGRLVTPLRRLTDIESDWRRGVAYVGMSRARTRLHVIIHEDCDEKRRVREEEWRERADSDVEMLL
jgi:hypothetical protein